jgi:5,10-methylenetetrahydrofolate reductase
MKYIKEHREWGEDRELTGFLRFCQQQLGYSTEPNIRVSDDHRAAVELKSMGYFNPGTKEIWVLRGDRVRADWYRTLAHELVHHAQREAGQELDGADGSDTENEANSLAGKLLREWGRRNPGIFG